MVGGDGAGGRCGRCPGPLAYAGGALACILAAIAIFDSHWLLGEPARTALAGAFMAVSVILAFAVVLSGAVAAASPPCGSGRTKHSSPPVPAHGAATGVPAPVAAAAASAESAKPAGSPAVAPRTILSVFAVATMAAIALTAVAAAPTYAPHPYPPGHMGIVQAMAACHATEAGCGRAAVGGGGGGGSAQAHLLAPPPVITTVGVPAVVPISGMLPDDARPPTRVGLVVEGPVGSPDYGRDEYSVMSTAAGRYSLHPSILPPSPGTHVYAVSASYDSRDLGMRVDAGTVSFTVMVLQPEISRSAPAPDGPLLGLLLPEDIASMGEGNGIDGAGSGMDAVAAPPAAPPAVVNGMLTFAPPPPTVSTGQVVRITFAYTDGVPRDSSAYVRGPDRARLTEPAYAGSGSSDGTTDPPGAYSFIVQPTWRPGMYGVVVAFGGGGGDKLPTASTAGILPIQVAVGAPPLDKTALEDGVLDASFSCIVPFGRVGPGVAVDLPSDEDTNAEPIKHGRTGGCYAGTVRGVTGPDALDVDGRPVTLTVSNARTARDAAAEDASAQRLAELCPVGSIVLVDRDDTLAVDGREPNPTVRGGYYSAVWCLGAGGAAYDGSVHVPVNRLLMAEGHAEPDPLGCLSSERRLEWDECAAYTAVEQAVGGALSTAIDAVTTAAASGGDVAAGGGVDGTSADPEDNGGGDCAIATAVYGTPAAASAQSVREYRDIVLGGSGGDHGLLAPALHAYYAVSPAAADMLRDSPYARSAAAAALAAPLAAAAAAANAAVHGGLDSGNNGGNGDPPHSPLHATLPPSSLSSPMPRTEAEAA